jgi:2-dehydro-3-deoxyphosphogluconate aldolase / (4S)-4-hydroxy-2-oxoglutarate aldolase
MARFTRIQVASKMAETGIVPVFYHKDKEVCKQVILACHKGGVKVFEFTNRGDYAHETFGELNKWAQTECPDLIMGAGSISDAPTAALYIQLGANFIVSPVLNEEMAPVVNRRKILWSPGCGSVTEISKAESLGVEIVKIFPGSQVGGPKFVAAVKGPMPWTNIMPTGGVEPTESNLTDWFKAGVICVGMGSQLLSSDILKNKDWKKLQDDVRNVVEIIRMLKQQYPVNL